MAMDSEDPPRWRRLQAETGRRVRGSLPWARRPQAVRTVSDVPTAGASGSARDRGLPGTEVQRSLKLGTGPSGGVRGACDGATTSTPMHTFALMHALPKPLLVFAAVASLAGCQTTERVADTAAEGVEDGADAVVKVGRVAADAAGDAAGMAAGAVTDAAGSVYRAGRDLFDSDPEASDVALIRPTSSASQVQGTVRFRESDGTLMAIVSLRGLAPGPHGFHVHQNALCGKGDADNDGTMEPGGAAGGHWDPMDTNNHGAPTAAMRAKHLGDMGNLTASADGTAEATITVAGFPSDRRLAGHAVIVHSGRDDLATDPGGDAGSRVGCGVIEGRM